jgi:adenine-specific DNA-methyltransferase
MPMPNQPKNRQQERVAGASPDLQAELRAQLRALAPEAFAEGRLDAGKLKALLGENGDAGPERYSFSWAGKRDAIAMLQVPTRATLVPDRANSVNFDEAQHVFIEGENLEVLKVLYRSYFGRVKMIYIDPPYNTGNDFIYPDDFADPLDNYLRITGQKNGNGDYTTSQVDKTGRIHSAWLSMMYPRLALARQFLRDDGVIFISGDDHEFGNLRTLMNEIFGEENFVATCIWQKRYSRENRGAIGDAHDYIVIYAANRGAFETTRNLIPMTDDQAKVYKNPNDDPNGRWRAVPMTAQGYRPNQMYEIETPSGRHLKPPEGRCWSMVETEFLKLKAGGRIYFGKEGDSQPGVIRYLSEVEGLVPWTWWPSTEVGHTDEARKEIREIFGSQTVFDTPKPTRLIRRMLQIATIPGAEDIVLDFFAGSNTTTQAVVEQNQEDAGNRRVITVQFPAKLPIPEANRVTLADVARERATWALKTANGNGTTGGFRAFKLQSSNFSAWSGVADKDVATLANQIEAFADSLVPSWKPENVIWEVALREGYSLTSRIEKIRDTGKPTFWRVTDPDREQSFVICLDDTLTLEAVRTLKLPKNALFICRDTALDDTLSANLALQCRLKVL